MSMGSLLEVRGLQAWIGRFHILQGVDFAVPEGETTVLLGRNGAGKTTTLRAIMGLVGVRQGSIRLGGQELAGRRPYEIAQLGIGYVPEDRGIFRFLTVEENLRVAERSRGALKRREDLIYGLFPDLARFRQRKAGHLSGGQQQMLAIARALVNDNRLLLIDEPSKGLAPIVVQHLTETLAQIARHVTVLLVEQNFAMAARLGRTCVVIDAGRVVHAGPMDELVASPELQRRWLGVGEQKAS
ncbi:MAG: ABC transporter ATP-binding protein [Limnochordales bacterium]